MWSSSGGASNVRMSVVVGDSLERVLSTEFVPLERVRSTELAPLEPTLRSAEIGRVCSAEVGLASSADSASLERACARAAMDSGVMSVPKYRTVPVSFRYLVAICVCVCVCVRVYVYELNIFKYRTVPVSFRYLVAICVCVCELYILQTSLVYAEFLCPL
jgi:hypothetical protein